MLDSIGLIIFGDDDTINSGTNGVSAGLGFIDLTTAYQTIFSATSIVGGNYVNDSITIDARLDNDNFAVVFRITIVDGFDGVIDEPVDGTLNVFVDERRFYAQPSPTYTIGLLP
jgi:hypothetical protein